MNLNNSIRRLPLIGGLLNKLVAGERRTGVRFAIRVSANAVTIYAGPFHLTWWPGGRGINRYDHGIRGEGDWYRSLMGTLPLLGFHHISLDREPAWRRHYR